MSVCASALMFVAYTGYGRIAIATLGEEVSEPDTTIPKAIILAMVFIVILYLAVSLTALQVMRADAFGQTVEGEAAPLMVVAQALSALLMPAELRLYPRWIPAACFWLSGSSMPFGSAACYYLAVGLYGTSYR